MLAQILRWRYRIGVMPLADPEIPAWVMNAIAGSPAACAIVFVGYLLRAAIDRQAPVFAGAIKLGAAAIKLLAEAIHNSTTDMQDALLDAQPRAEPPPRPPSGRRRTTGRHPQLPPDQSRTG